jgi:transcriptional regulator with XRE-family HTH domain
VNTFGERIKQLREQRCLLQKHIAGKLDIDTPMLSKIERGERRAKREQVLQVAEIFKVNQNELITLWLADKVYEVIKDEDVASRALKVAEKEYKYTKTTSKP